MLARSSTPGEHDSPAPIAIPTLANTRHHIPPTKKRKKDSSSAPTATASPAPESEGQGPEGVLSADLSHRARLSISRHPVFVPIAEDSPYHHTDQLAHNRLGFRYVPAGVAPPTFRTIESEPTEYRVSWEDRSTSVKVTLDGLGLLGEKGFRGARCNAPVREGKWYMEVVIEKGGGEKVDLEPGEGAHVRLGWARREAPLNAPCGLDGYSYALRDKTGEKVTLSRPRPYGLPVRSGDVVGLYISLPPLREPDPKDPADPAHLKRKHIPIEFKGQEYFESLEYPQTKEMIALMDYKTKADTSAPAPPPGAKKGATMKNVSDRARGSDASTPTGPTLRPLPTLEGSQVAFFVNGTSPGTAFHDIYDFRPLSQPTSAHNRPEKRRREREGAPGHRENPFDDGTLGYYPFISLFGHAQVRLNPGPDFAFPPPPDIDAALVGGPDSKQDLDASRTWRPLCERYKEFMEEQWALDEIEREAFMKELARRIAEDREEAKKNADRARKRDAAAARKQAKKDQAALSTAAGPSTTEQADSPAPTPAGAYTSAMHSRAPSELGEEGDTGHYTGTDDGGPFSREDSLIRDLLATSSTPAYKRAPSEGDVEMIWQAEEEEED